MTTESKPSAKKAARCKWCDAGHSPSNGEHWIVKSIRRPTINIYACKAVLEKEPR